MLSGLIWGVVLIVLERTIFSWRGAVAFLLMMIGGHFWIVSAKRRGWL
jgi:hypothetical protein